MHFMVLAVRDASPYPVGLSATIEAAGDRSRCWKTVTCEPMTILLLIGNDPMLNEHRKIMLNEHRNTHLNYYHDGECKQVLEYALCALERH